MTDAQSTLTMSRDALRRARKNTKRGTVIFDAPLSSLRDAVLDITPTATPGRFRLIDCIQFTEHQTLRILEFHGISRPAYAAISYTWRGIIGPPPAPMAARGTFAVTGAEDGDPISIDLLFHACTAALRRPLRFDLEDTITKYLWLDRLCIMQTSKDDKAWQIGRMYRLYEACNECIILPGGTRRLASLYEPTMWIHRGWTLQEAVAPRRAMLLFAWGSGHGTHRSGRTNIAISEVVPGESALAELEQIIKASIADPAISDIRLDSEGLVSETLDLPTVFGNSKIGADARHLMSLAGALKQRRPEWRELALWRSALMRTSSRPVDMVFSIMGFFGIILDTRAFHKDDRLGATIALSREILRRGGKPSWLTISLTLPRCPQLSSFPMFPQTNEAGGAMLVMPDGVRDIAEVIEDADWWAEDLPNGSMDPAGYLTITTEACPVVDTGQRRTPNGEVPDPADVDSMEGTSFELTAQDGRVLRTATWTDLSEAGGTTMLILKLGSFLGKGWFEFIGSEANPHMVHHQKRKWLFERSAPCLQSWHSAEGFYREPLSSTVTGNLCAATGLVMHTAPSSRGHAGVP